MSHVPRSEKQARFETELARGVGALRHAAQHADDLGYEGARDDLLASVDHCNLIFRDSVSSTGASRRRLRRQIDLVEELGKP